MRCTWLLIVRIKARSFTVCIKGNTLKGKYSKKINKLVSVNPSGEPLDSVDCLSVVFSLFLNSSCKIFSEPAMFKAKKVTFLIRLFRVAAPLRCREMTTPPTPPSVSFGTGERIDLNLTLNLRKRILFFPFKKDLSEFGWGACERSQSRRGVPAGFSGSLACCPPPDLFPLRFGVFVFESVDRYAEV